MKKKCICTLIGLFAFALTGTSQSTPFQVKAEIPFSPSCGHDATTVLKGAIKKGKYGGAKVNAPATAYPPSAILTCGKFDVYFDDIFLSTGQGFNDPSAGILRQNTLCNVLTYIQSRLDFSSISPTNHLRINVLQSYAPGSNPAPPTTNWLGQGTPLYFNTGTPHLIYGFAYDYVKSGTDPVTVNDFHGTLMMNFDMAGGTPISWQDDNTATFVNCNYDLFSVMLHEITHTLGWFSLTNMVGGAPASLLGSNQYSGLDYLVYKGTIVSPLAVIKLIQGPTTSPVINPVVAANVNALQQMDLWINNKTCPYNHPVYSGAEALSLHPFDINKTISHMDDRSWAFAGRQRISPGDQQDYVVAPMIARGHLTREYTKGEIQTLSVLGYNLNPTFTATYPFVLTNNTPYSSNLVLAPNYTEDSYPDTVAASFSIVNNIGASFVINLALNSVSPVREIGYDVDLDPVSVYPNSIFNIRGCGNGGNNHNCLSVSGSGQQITFTPRPGFYGRAQFGFTLYDGKEKGGLSIVTLMVEKGTNVSVAPGGNYLMNGDFEEGTEVKRLGAEEIVPNVVSEHDVTRDGRYRYGTVYGDGELYNDAVINNVYAIPCAYGTHVVHNSMITCNGTSYLSNTYSGSFSGAINPTFGQRYYSLHTGSYHNFFLKKPLIVGKAYTLEYDYYSYASVGMIPFDVRFTDLGRISQVPYGTTPVPGDYQFTTNFNSANSSWTHASQSFTFCGGSTDDVLNLSSTSSWQMSLYIDNLTVKESAVQPPNSLTVIDNLSGQSCLGKSVLMTATGGNPICGASNTYSWLPVYLTGTSVVVSPTVTTTYTIISGTNVSTTHTIFVNNPIVSISPASPGLVCNTGPTAVTLNASGASTYTWLPGPIVGNTAVYSPVINTVYTVTGSDGYGCTNTQTILVTYNNAPCACTSCNATAINSVLGGGTLGSAVYCINNSIIITGNVILSGDYKISSGVSITIASTGNLTINNAHFYGCTNMWQGFIVQDGGRLTINNSMIEDAMTAIDVTNNTQTSTVLNLTAVLFNKNGTGINIENYTQNITAPFTITSCLFTCRNIPTAALSFPSVSSVIAPASNPEAPLSNDLINNSTYLETGSAALLKFPNAPDKSYCGLRLKNVGQTLNHTSTSATYYEFILGNTSRNVFDNLNTSVDLINSNFTCYNTIYQNPKNNNKVGINAVADRYNHNRLQVLPLSGTINKFVDCDMAINVTDYFECNINSSNIKTTQHSSANPTRETSGISITTSRYKLLDVSDNFFTNMTHNLYLTLRSGNFIIPGVTATYGQYTGIVKFNRNQFAQQISGYSVTYQRVGGAIITRMYLGGSAQIFDNPSTHITQIDKNNMSNCLVGVEMTSFENHNVSINSNGIAIEDNSYQSYYPNHAIGCINSIANPVTPIVVANNVITGYGTANPSAYGIEMSSNVYSDVNCNDVSNVTNALAFEFTNPGANIYNNILSADQYGLMLDYNAVIGPQGNPSTPQDNQWMGAWFPPNFETALFNGSDATPNTLFIRTTTPSPFNPDGSSISTTPPAFSTDYEIANNNLRLSPGAGPVLGCPIIISTARMASSSNVPSNNGNAAMEYVVAKRNPETVKPEVDFIQKGQVYRLLSKNPDVITNSSDLTNFMGATQNSSYELFRKIESQLSKGNFQSAAALTENIHPINKVETNYKNFYKLAINHGLSIFTSQDSISLRNIANLCPYEDGLIVNDARVLLFLRYRINTIGTSCQPKGVSINTSSKDLPNTLSSDIYLFPNPAIKRVNITSNKFKNGSASITVTDVDGKIVYEKNVQVTNTNAQFDLDVANGVYFVKIVQPETNTNTLKKLIIQK